MKIYLASGSPRRKKLLGWMGLEFEIVGHRVDEKKVKADNSEDLAAKLAILKASNPRKKIRGLVIGSDLIVDLKGELIGKPKNKVEAKDFLRKLSGREHKVLTGVAVYNTIKDEGRMSVCETRVKMKKLSEAIIEKYVNSFKVTDKGGGYSIKYQLKGFGSLVKEIKGSYTNVWGLPLEYLENLLKDFGVKPEKDWRKKCKKETGYEY